MIKQLLIIINAFVVGHFTKYPLGWTSFLFPVIGNIVGQELIEIGERLDQGQFLWSDIFKVFILNMVYLEATVFTCRYVWMWIVAS